VDPNLAIRNAKGEIETVRYSAINVMLLNEFLKEHKAFVARAGEGEKPGSRNGRTFGDGEGTSSANPKSECAGSRAPTADEPGSDQSLNSCGSK
jgi:hypothetical protein